MLCEAIEEMRRGLVDAEFGGGVVKKRVRRPGHGKSGGYRTLLATNQRDRWVFLFGFAKNERDNVDDDELQALKRLARNFLGMSNEVIEAAKAQGDLTEICDGEQKTA